MFPRRFSHCALAVLAAVLLFAGRSSATQGVVAVTISNPNSSHVYVPLLGALQLVVSFTADTSNAPYGLSVADTTRHISVPGSGITATPGTSYGFTWTAPDTAHVGTSFYVMAYTTDAQVDEVYSRLIQITMISNGPRDATPADLQYLGCFRLGADGRHPTKSYADLFTYGAPSSMAYGSWGDATADGFPGVLWCSTWSNQGQTPTAPYDSSDDRTQKAVHAGGMACAMSIPAPLLYDGTLSHLNMASIVRPCKHIAWDYFNVSNWGGGYTTGTARINALWADELKSDGTAADSAHTIWSQRWDYYGVTDGEVDPLVAYTRKSGNDHGAFHLGPHNPSRHSVWYYRKWCAYSMGRPTTSWVSRFTGITSPKFLAVGSGAREGGYSGACDVAIDDYGRQGAGNGPSFGVYVFPDTTAATATEAQFVPIMYYTNGHRVAPHLVPPAASDTLNDCDLWQQGVWVDTGQVAGLFYVCHKCKYIAHYFEPGSPDQTCLGSDPGVCHQDANSNAFVCGRYNTDDPLLAYENRLYIYSVNDMTAMAQGHMQPYEAEPISYLVLDQFFLPYKNPNNLARTNDCNRPVGGVCYDSTNHLLYVAQPNCDNDGNSGSGGRTGGGNYDPSPVVHVFRVGVAGEAP